MGICGQGNEKVSKNMPLVGRARQEASESMPYMYGKRKSFSNHAILGQEKGDNFGKQMGVKRRGVSAGRIIYTAKRKGSAGPSYVVEKMQFQSGTPAKKPVT